MKRRDFLQASAVAACLSVPGAHAAESSSGSPAEYYEWRTYRFADRASPALNYVARVLHYLEHAVLPAWQRLGIGPVGVFTEVGDNASSSVHVLIVYKTIDDFAVARTALESDGGYVAAAADYHGAAMQDPAFDRIESSLMVAFAGQPKLMVPERKDRVFELREYQSHSEAKARRKIEMFNNGETPIFRSVGFETVFFGETLIGSRLPNLKYMLAAENLDACKMNFDKFRVHPDWVAMKDLPEYAETVSAVVQTFLMPTAFSQI